MIKEDYHVHSVFSDGGDTLADMAAQALSLGAEALGFSDHGWASYDEDCCMRRDRIDEYRASVLSLREEYRGRMKIFCGVEQDYYSELPAQGYDYVIGSVHYLYLRGEYLNVDWKREKVYRAAELLGGDMYAVCEEYFRLVGDVVEKTGCQIIGHFNLIAKLNGDGALFDETHPRYVAAWRRAADRLLSYGIPFEINTGAISRGYRTDAYPADDMLRYLAERGASFLLSSDAHQKENLLYQFDCREQALQALGGRLLTGQEWMRGGK